MSVSVVQLLPQVHLLQQLRRQETVLEITRLLAQKLHLDDLLPVVVAKTCAALNADRATLWLVEREAGQIWTKVASQLELKEIRMPLGVGFAGYVAQTGQTLNVRDCYADPRFNPDIDRRTGYLTRTVLVMPMRDPEGETIGVFQVLNKLRDDGTLPSRGSPVWPTFDDDDVDLLAAIAASAAIAVANAQLLAQVKEMFGSTIQVLATALDRCTPETAGHSQRVAAGAVILARRMGLPPQEVEKLRYAALLHDVGKIAIHGGLLAKPGSLTEAERAQVHDHPRYTREILGAARFLRGFEDIPLIAAQHHERLDGSGYPFGHKGDDITLGGRLLAVVDMYDALRQPRAYKAGLPVAQCLAILRREVERRRLDPRIVALLGQCVHDVEAASLPLRPDGPHTDGLLTDSPARLTAS